MSPVYLLGKYGYKNILSPLLEDLQHLETTGINVLFQGREYLFFGSLSMVIADNLAARALGGFFCNFSTVQRFCRFYNCRKCQLIENIPIGSYILRTKNAYENNLQSVEIDPKFS